MVIHAFITSNLDYCNSLYSCLSKHSLYRLKLIQNAAARLLTNSNKRVQITPNLSSLHWLPVRFGIDFKILIITFQARVGLAPEYINECLIPYVA